MSFIIHDERIKQRMEVTEQYLEFPVISSHFRFVSFQCHPFCNLFFLWMFLQFMFFSFNVSSIYENVSLFLCFVVLCIWFKNWCFFVLLTWMFLNILWYLYNVIFHLMFLLSLVISSPQFITLWLVCKTILCYMFN